ncbi:MAG TPA: glutamyl-tRNA reductase [Virgibacillus sp.]|nr:glutamyl-tRNA reductase [Virgibacillus sp.]
MHIIKVGINYQTAPVKFREKLVFAQQDLKEAMTQLNVKNSVLENVIISTCNRTEVYAVIDQWHTGRDDIINFLAVWFNVDEQEIGPYIQVAQSDAAIDHLFRVTTGLNSMVLGETQILGQVRDAFLTAQKLQVTGTLFNELFKQAITLAKRAHRSTLISEHAVSVSYAAVELVKEMLGDLANKQVVIIGAGEMAELAIQNFHSSGVKEIIVVNRTFERAKELASRFGAQATKYDELLGKLTHVDIVLSSTSASTVILSKDELEPIQKQRAGKPLFLIDIAVPRDLDPMLIELNNVFLYDVDDLQHIVDKNLAARKKAAEVIQLMIDEEIIKYKQWVTTLEAVPVISALSEKAKMIQQTTLKSIERKIPTLTDREKRVLEKHTTSIVNQLLKQPILESKELAAKKNSTESLSLVVDIFGLDEHVKEDVREQAKLNKSLKKLNLAKQTFFTLANN